MTGAELVAAIEDAAARAGVPLEALTVSADLDLADDVHVSGSYLVLRSAHDDPCYCY